MTQIRPASRSQHPGKGDFLKMSDWEPKIVAFLCNWCSYGAADLAGVGRMEYPTNIRVIRIPCTGRMSPKFFLAALREGADGVWVSG
jgi:coenzyme F420-reducing hydrogenase delta subunit